MTAQRLENIAVYYCQRFLASENKLAEYLARRVRRDADPAEGAVESFAEDIERIVAKMASLGLVNDREAAAAKLRQALRSGHATGSAVRVAARSARVDAETVARELPTALADAVPAVEDQDEADQGVALARLALQRARRGPHRRGGGDETTKRRDVAWLQRRGFRFDDIARAMEISDDE